MSLSQCVCVQRKALQGARRDGGCWDVPEGPSGGKHPATCDSFQQTQMGLLVAQGGLATACLEHRTLEVPSGLSSWRQGSSEADEGGSAWPASGTAGCQAAPQEEPLGLRGGGHHAGEVTAPDISAKLRDFCRTCTLFCLKDEVSEGGVQCLCWLQFVHCSFEFFIVCPSGCLEWAPERRCFSSESLNPLQSQWPHPFLPHRPHQEVTLCIRSTSCERLFTSCLRRKQWV